MEDNRNCYDCEHAVIKGKHLPQTLEREEENPEFEECGYPEEEKINKFFSTIDAITDVLEVVNDEDSQKMYGQMNSLEIANYCPFYRKRYD